MLEKKPYLREARIEDMQLLFIWSNDEKVRKNSFINKNIKKKEHFKWFKNQLEDQSINIYILMQSDNPIGQVRVKFSNNEGVISYSIDSKYRGLGYGKVLLRLLEEQIIKNNESKKSKVCLIGAVKEENIASQKVFEELNYVKEKRNASYYYSKVI